MKRAPPPSLFGQVAAAQGAFLLAFAIALPLLLSYFLNRTADDFVAARLHIDAKKIAASMQKAPGGYVQAHTTGLGPLYDARGGNKAYAVFDEHGKIIARGGSDMRVPAAFPASPAGRFFEYRDYFAYGMRLTADPASPVILVEQNRTDPDVVVDDVVTAFLRRFLWLVPAALLLSLLFGWVVARRATARLETVARTADRIEPYRLDYRLDRSDVPIELLPLVDAANRAFDRLEIGFREQSEFVANVVHELRTPLAVLALRAEAVEDRKLRASICNAIERASHVVSQLMQLARIENAAPEFEPFDLSEMVRETVREQAPIIYRNGKQIEFCSASDGAPIVNGNSGLIEIVLNNLIGNAVQHTPEGTSIKVVVGPGRTVSVIDDGPGIQQSDDFLLRQRYWRADQRNSEGAGLGLAISERIMALHRGRLELVMVGNGGAHFRIQFEDAVG
jgi:signal transduction histidine kinase